MVRSDTGIRPAITQRRYEKRLEREKENVLQPEIRSDPRYKRCDVEVKLEPD